MKVLSLIVPAYNSEQYLDTCIGSFLDEKILDKLDIVIVNDGSTDGTEAIAQGYCKAYPDSVRLISQENRGHGGALNAGCAAAKGKYLKVIDADDWVETENLAAFIKKLEICESDVVLTHYYTHDISSDEIQWWGCQSDKFDKSLSFRDIMADFYSYERCLTFHGVTYKTSFYHQWNYQLSEKIFYEDHEFATFPCCHAKGITPVELSIYDYRIGDVAQSVSDENKLKRLTHSEAVLRRMIKEYQNAREKLGKHAAVYVHYKIKVVLLSYLTTVLLVEKDKKLGRVQADRIMKYIRSTLPEVYSLAAKKYQVLRVLNGLGMEKSMLDGLMNSPLYQRITGKVQTVKETK